MAILENLENTEEKIKIKNKKTSLIHATLTRVVQYLT